MLCGARKSNDAIIVPGIISDMDKVKSLVPNEKLRPIG